tara:strand:+ start:1208 stop:1528 length:321 start_codon:yes stop_codon:yes gene_type:complete
MLQGETPIFRRRLTQRVSDREDPQAQLSSVTLSLCTPSLELLKRTPGSVLITQQQMRKTQQFHGGWQHTRTEDLLLQTICKCHDRTAIFTTHKHLISGQRPRPRLT